jgi:Zn-dependent M28 family amino/carboxypeptidase
VEEALAAGPARLTLEVTGETADAESGNLVAVREGSSALPEILVGGHLDSYDLCEGATDNGAGAALILEVARVFSLLPAPRRTVRFVFFTGEEKATIGSRRYVKDRVADPSSLGLFFNVDVPAEGGVPGILKTGWDEDGGWLDALAAKMEHRFPVRDVPPRFSDHAPFAQAGVPCLWVQSVNAGIRGPANHEHTVLDTEEKVDMVELREATMLAARILVRLANAETLPVSRPRGKGA